MIWGIITAVLFVAVAGKFITKRYLKGANKALSKIHKPAGIFFAVLIIIHFIITWSLRRQRPVEMYITGMVMLISCIIAILCWIFRKKLGVKWIKIHRFTALLILICLLIHIYYGISSLKNYKKDVKNITYNNIDITGVKDGEYTGEYDVGYIYAKVLVIVKNGAITSIEILEHRTEKGQPAEKIVNTMVEEQQIYVDTVTGATNSSKVIIKAVENALKGEKNHE